MTYVNVFYFHTLNAIGGIETFFYQLGKKYGKEFDITVFYRNGDPQQVKRLSEVVRTKKYRDGMKIRCKRAFACFNTDILDEIEADEYYQMLHGDYTSLGVYPTEHPKLQKWIAVSEVVRDAYKRGKGEDSIVSYNPYTPVKPSKVLNLVSATRLTPDKGSKRMEILAQKLDEAGIKYIWTVYSDSGKVFSNPNIIVRPPRLDIVDFIANADYFVQLSDAEGYCYSVVEALCVGTPVIVTDFKVAREIGVQDGKNGFILPMDMSEIPVAKIYKGLKKFTYTPLEDRWGELLVKGETEKKDPTEIVRVRAYQIYFDLEMNRTVTAKEEFETNRYRAEYLEAMDLVEILE